MFYFLKMAAPTVQTVNTMIFLLQVASRLESLTLNTYLEAFRGIHFTICSDGTIHVDLQTHSQKPLHIGLHRNETGKDKEPQKMHRTLTTIGIDE